MTRATCLALFLSCVLFSPTAAVTCKAPTMTINEYREIMESEMEAEFLDLTEKVGSEAELLAVVKPVWDAANDYELNRAEEEELSSGKPYPYIVCHRGSAAGMSTNKRKKAVKERLMAAAVAAKNFSQDEATEYVQNINYATMAVKDDLFCGVTRLHASIACEISDESNSISVQPMIMSLKMAADTVGTILDRMADTALQFEGDPNVDFTLCPGATTDAKFAEKDITTTMGGGDVTEEFIAFLLDRGENFSCADPNITSAASSALYWTDPASPTLTEQVSITKRTIYWAELFDRSLNTCNCDDMYTNRLRATVTEGDPSNPHDPDILNILFMSEGATPSDTDCAIALVAAGALQPEICHVEVQGVVDTGNDIAQWLAQGGVGSEDAMETPLYDAGITGAGQVVAVSDTGLDYENCYFMDANAPDPSAARNDAHRKVVSYNPFVDDADAKNGHGTHVCGIVAGHRSEGGMEQTDGVANGIAYDAKIAFLDIGFPDQSLSLPRRDSDILSTGRGTGDDSKDAHIHSASWGGATNSYTGQARNFDNFMFKNDDFLILVAAGNSGRDGLNSVGTPATAKNILSVGAHNSVKSASGGLGPTYVADFSSRGPTADGRMKPDILAPGKFLVSAGADPENPGSCDDGSLTDKPFRSGSSPGLLSLAGTSMATPATSGSAALIRQYLVEGWHQEGTKGSGQSVQPSGALVKAILMNGAQFMEGVDDGGFTGNPSPVEQYDTNQGFGRVSLMDSVFIANKTRVQIAFFEDAVEDGGEHTYNVTIDKSGGCGYPELRATLVWTEPGSQSGCKFCLINDLDLTVTKVDGNGTVMETYYPNGKNGRDTTNNAERAIVGNTKDGDQFVVTVSGTNLESDQQKYAVVMSGCFGGSAVSSAGGNAFEDDDSNDMRKFILIGVGAGVAAILVFIFCICCCKRRK